MLPVLTVKIIVSKTDITPVPMAQKKMKTLGETYIWHSLKKNYPSSYKKFKRQESNGERVSEVTVSQNIFQIKYFKGKKYKIE